MKHFYRIYYLVPTREVMRKFKERFNTTVTVNYESHIYTDGEGKHLIEESAKRGYIRIREYKEL